MPLLDFNVRTRIDQQIIGFVDGRLHGRKNGRMAEVAKFAST